MSAIGEVIEGYPSIARLHEIQILPGVDPVTEEILPCVSMQELMFLSRQAFMEGHKRQMSWEKFSSIVASWRSMLQRTATTNAIVDIKKFEHRRYDEGLAGVGLPKEGSDEV